MRTTKKWFHTATMMAFFAVLALFVSPILAWSCCCSGHAPTTPSRISTTTINLENTVEGGHDCCPSTADSSGFSAHKTDSPAVQNATLECVTISNVCDCEKDSSGVLALNERFSSFNFFPLATVATPQQLFSPTESQRIVTYFNRATPPRGPDSRTRSSRGPPSSLLS
jgi:hypothetical protein